jgi:hypothetical protein
LRTIQQIKTELKTIVDAGLEAGVRRDSVALKAADEAATGLYAELKTAERHEAIGRIGGIQTFDVGPDLATALLDAGFDRKGHPSVTVAQHFALGVQFKAGSVDGAIDGTEVPDRFVAPGLGLDSRYLYPHLRTQGVAADDTGVQSYRQKSRSLASASTMIRDVDDDSTKPETSTVSEPVVEKLHQIANVSSGTPNVLLANQGFRNWVNDDLTGAYRAAVDFHIVTEINGAGIGVAAGGENIYEQILYAQEAVATAGYTADVIALSPGDALALRLTVMTGGDTYIFATPAPTVVVSPSIDNDQGFVFDSSALGILFLGPFSLQAFEENAGTTNTSTVRAESNGLFLAQRPDAAASLSGS